MEIEKKESKRLKNVEKPLEESEASVKSEQANQRN